MAKRGPRITAPRQWSLSLAETGDAYLYRATLRWRTFPCRADHWDGIRTAQILSVGPPIQTAEDLEAVLSLFIGVEWLELSPRSVAADPVER